MELMMPTSTGIMIPMQPGWKRLRPYPAIKIDSQTGKDFFSFEQNSRLIEVAAQHEVSTGVPVCHETHRNKFPFAAHVTFDYLKRYTIAAHHTRCFALGERGRVVSRRSAGSHEPGY